MKRIVYIMFLALMMAGGSVWAQSAYTVYPVPQEQIAGKGKASFTQKVCVVAEQGVDNYTIERALQMPRNRSQTSLQFTLESMVLKVQQTARQAALS